MIATKVPTDKMASNKASKPLPLKASELTFLPTFIKYKPKTILTNNATEMITIETML